MRRFLVFLIQLYQKGVSPFLPPRCRFYPSCSAYASSAIQNKGIPLGLFYTLKRLLRCHPFSEGGLDFPPAESQP